MTLHRPERTVTLTETVKITVQYHYTEGGSPEQVQADARQQLHKCLSEALADVAQYEVVASVSWVEEFPEGCPECHPAYAEQMQHGR